jgi:uncharacterized protein
VTNTAGGFPLSEEISDMAPRKWPIAISLAVLLLGARAWGSTIRDEAKMFSPRVVEEAQRRLDRLERATNIPVVIETIEHIPGLAEDAPNQKRREAINEAAKRRDQQIHDEGIYILISKKDRVISQPLIRERLERIVPESRRDAIREAFVAEFGKRKFDEGLERGVETIEKTLEGHRISSARTGARVGVPAPIGAGARRGQAGGGSSVFSTFLLIGLGILAVLILLRVLGGLFGRAAGGGYPNQMGQMGGPRPGMGPGYYGGPGYGGRGGGGFFSGLLGGLGGALAGNWLYDQMSGRHGGMTSAGAGYPVDESSASLPDQGDDAIIGSDDHGGQGGSWDTGGTDTGGGDWGGDAGGDWGGGGGDWGGGGGDWGGGGGGGDW